MNNQLAIIIPAFKLRFFEQTLYSLANQTNQNFTVYIGDDCSEEDIRSLCTRFTNKLDIQYHRFDSNLGGTNLVAQWARCVSLSHYENWIWLFSDDDVAEPECVEAFYNAVKETEAGFDAYRFDTVTIDERNNVTSVSPKNPQLEDYRSLAYHILLGERGNTMPDHIFSKSKYIEVGGFVNFPFAQASDFATSIRFSNPKGLYTIQGPKVKWRYSGYNISSIAYRLRTKAIFGYLEFVQWLVLELKIDEPDQQSVSQSKILTKKLLLNNLTVIIKGHYRGVPYSKLIKVSRIINGIFGWGFLQSLVYCLKINANIEKGKFAQTVKHLLRG